MAKMSVRNSFLVKKGLGDSKATGTMGTKKVNFIGSSPKYLKKAVNVIKSNPNAASKKAKRSIARLYKMRECNKRI